jgi:hypothetical protein
MTTRWSIALLFSLVARVLLAQAWTACDVQELLDHIKRNNELYGSVPSFQLNIDIASFRSYTDASPYDRATSLLTKIGKRYRVEALGMLTIQDELHRITVDSAEKVLMVGHAGDMMQAIGSDHSEAILKSASAISKRTTPSGTIYRATFREGSYYEHMEIGYDPKGWLSSVACYWRHAIQENPDDPRSPSYKPKITFTFDRPQSISASTPGGTLDLSSYVTFKDEKPLAGASYRDYELIDTRLP